LLHLHHQVRAEGVVRRDGLAPRKLPGARAVAERLRGQRTHRTDVDHVAGELGFDRAADERDDLGVLAAAGEAELHHAGDLLAEAHAARALDAAAHLLGGDQRAELFSGNHALFFLIARIAVAVADREVLQLALAALVADRAVERVVD